jgi:SAM-dependent methyltransferase
MEYGIEKEVDASAPDQSVFETDDLGDLFMRTYDKEARRASGSTYTPYPIVQDIITLARQHIMPERIIDCGCGSGRFAIACAATFKDARVIAIDSSAEACEMCSENVSRCGLADRIEVVNCDFLDYQVDEIPGRTLWISNPPYVRHHDIPDKSKRWMKDCAKDLGTGVSMLSGLHVYFLAKVARSWKTGDFGAFITSAEWLDVNYGSLMRELLVRRLGLVSLRLFDRHTRVFDSAETTSVIFGFGDGRDSISVQSPDGCIRQVPTQSFANSSRWSHVVIGEMDRRDKSDLVPLGSYIAVHRGLVTGDNKFWVRDAATVRNLPDELTVPIVSHAREITGDCVAQQNPRELKRLITLPEELDTLDQSSRTAARAIVREGRRQHVNKGYVADHRKTWWSIKRPATAPILMTYMSRNKPTFVVNKQNLPMLNVVHGLYPKQEMSTKALECLTDYLNTSVDLTDGRMYCGGLVKFEPREVEALSVPRISELEAKE